MENTVMAKKETVRGISNIDDARLMARIIDRFETAEGEEKLLLAFALLGVREWYNLDDEGAIAVASSYIQYDRFE
jgi:hypothetical protein